MADRAVSRRARQAEARADARFRLLRALGAAPALSQRGLADRADMSLGAVNAAVNGLIEAGLVAVVALETAPGGIGLAYPLTDAGRTELRRLAPGYLQRRRDARAALDAEIATLEADLPGDAGAQERA